MNPGRASGTRRAHVSWMLFSLLTALWWATTYAKEAELEETEVEAGEPLVIVVHGIGGGNRPIGWANDMKREWHVGRLVEVTYRYEGRTDPISFTDFAKMGGDWALSVQRQIKDAVRSNPGRPVVIVSHSWGSVATAMALSGGAGGGESPDLVRNTYCVEKIDLGGVKIKEWVTLGSPIGKANTPPVFGNLRQLNVDVPLGRPTVVEHWTNVFDVDDPVASYSHNLEGAENIPVTGSGSWWDVTGLSAHTGVWLNPLVKRRLFGTCQSLAPIPRKDRTRPGAQPASPTERILSDYRAVYKSYLTVFYANNLRVDLRANAAEVGTDQYRCAFGVFNRIPDGPRKGEIYECVNFDRFFTLDQLAGQIPQMKGYLKNPPKR